VKAIRVRADTISLKAISLIITGRETFLTNTHQWIALAEIRGGVLEVESGGRP
jgi:hypothetical protein